MVLSRDANLGKGEIIAICITVSNLQLVQFISRGFAHFLFSIFPVFGQRISCQETGSRVAPAVTG